MTVRRMLLAGFSILIAAPAAIAAPAVTIYTSDLGFIRETRTLELRAARDTVRLEGVPERLDFSSVRLAPADATAKITRLAYRYDVAATDQLLQNSKGRRVRVTSRGERATEGTLISADGAFVTVRGENGSLTSVAMSALETVQLLEPPASLALKPQLIAAVESGRAGKIEAELSYLTGGLSWAAEHVVVRRGESAASWATNVTVDNQTGIGFESANVKLVAGDPRRAGSPSPAPFVRAAMMKEMTMGSAAADMSEESFADYHLYTLVRPASLRDRESQSLVMHDSREIKVTPRYFYRGGDPRGVAVQLEVQNSAASGLGVPLPGGRVRFYEPDGSGALQFTGEATIKHTAENEKLTMDVGSAFDIAAERREMSNTRISDREREVSVTIELRNRKKTAVTIVVQENLGGDITILKSSLPSRRKDANTLEFDVPAPAGKEVTLSYTYRVRY